MAYLSILNTFSDKIFHTNYILEGLFCMSLILPKALT